MLKRIEIEISGFGKRYSSDNVQYYCEDDYYCLYFLDKNNKEIWHNEYGLALEWKDGSYAFYIKNKPHRLDGPAIYNAAYNEKRYYINAKFIGDTEEEFIQYKNEYLLIV